MLNYAALGVEMVIPTSGSYFHLQGGMRIKRHNTDNPIEKEDLANGVSGGQDYEGIYILGNPKYSPYLSKPAPKKTIYEIYAEGAGRQTMTNGFKPKKEKGPFGDHKKVSIQNPGAQSSTDKKGKDYSRSKDQTSNQKSFTSKALKQRINDNMRIGDISQMQ